MEAARTRAPVGLSYDRRGGGHLLKLASDEALVRRVRSGSERAFTVLYERHFRAIFAYCRHMLGSHEEAEDAVQLTFVSAYRSMLRDDKELHLRPWLYRIARNHCISTLRRRRPQAELGEEQPSLTGLAEEVSGRGELRALLADLARLPHDQREALVLTELHDNSHSEVAEILDCDREKVKSLVFQARSSLIKSRAARELGCDDVRLQLSSVKGSALRRGALGRHLQHCDGCRAFAAELRRQRQQLAVLLAVVPTSALKLGASTAVAAASAKAGGAGLAATSAAGSAPVAGIATGAGGGSIAALTAKVGTSGLVLKGIATTTAVGVLAAGGTVGVQRVGETVRHGGLEQVQSAGRGEGAGTISGRPATTTSGRGSRSPLGHRFEGAPPARKRALRDAPGAPLSQARPRFGAPAARPGGGQDRAARGDPRRGPRNGLERRRQRRRAPARRERAPVAGAPAERPLETPRPERPGDGSDAPLLP